MTRIQAAVPTSPQPHVLGHVQTANQTLSFSKQIYMHVSASTLHMPFCFGKQNTFRYFLHVFVLEGDWAISSTCHVVISKMILSGEFSEGTNLNDRTVNRMLSSTK